MTHNTGCLICGKELVYFETERDLVCMYCGETHSANASCVDGHFVCDRCHGSSANDLIERTCLQETGSDPLALAIKLMRSPQFHMHGPEHHFMVPAVLLAAWHNQSAGPQGDLAKQLAQARKRAEIVPGGFCGFQGACGAAIGTGIFVSVITESTPTSKETWGLSNLMTAESLKAIAEPGGPRCCKRDSFLALLTAMEFMKVHFGATWQVEQPVICTFISLNKECIHRDCPFFGAQAVKQKYQVKLSDVPRIKRAGNQAEKAS